MHGVLELCARLRLHLVSDLQLMSLFPLWDYRTCCNVSVHVFQQINVKLLYARDALHRGVIL